MIEHEYFITYTPGWWKGYPLCRCSIGFLTDEEYDYFVEKSNIQTYKDLIPEGAYGRAGLLRRMEKFGAIPGQWIGFGKNKGTKNGFLCQNIFFFFQILENSFLARNSRYLRGFFHS